MEQLRSEHSKLRGQMSLLQSELLNLSLTDFKTSITDSASQINNKIHSVSVESAGEREGTPKANSQIYFADQSA